MVDSGWRWFVTLVQCIENEAWTLQRGLAIVARVEHLNRRFTRPGISYALTVSMNNTIQLKNSK